MTSHPVKEIRLGAFLTSARCIGGDTNHRELKNASTDCEEAAFVLAISAVLVHIGEEDRVGE